jgi:predicted MFS family arabinose efflux permease
MTFLVLAAIGSAAVLLLWVGMPETRPPEKQPSDVVNAEKATQPA